MKEKSPPTIYQKLAAIQTSLKVKKTSYNSFGKYYFRNSETILEALKPLLREQGCIVTINEDLNEIAGLPVLTSYARISDGNDMVEAVALVAVDLDQKGMNAPQKFGSASSYAKKYALGNLFLIDDTADSDATNKHGKEKPAKVTLTSTKDPLYEKALAFVVKGGDVSAIAGKYSLSAEVKKSLEAAVTTKKATL